MDNDIIENATIVPLEELGHEPTDEEIMELFGRVRRSRMRHGHGGPCGQHRPGDAASDPRSAQGRILLLLKSAGAISQRDLRRIVGIRPQSLGELLAKLEAAGYIERTPNESDRRTMDVRITEAGRAVEQRGGSPAMLADLDEQDRRDLYRILAKMAPTVGTAARGTAPTAPGIPTATTGPTAMSTAAATMPTATTALMAPTATAATATGTGGAAARTTVATGTCTAGSGTAGSTATAGSDTPGRPVAGRRTRPR